MRTCLITTTLAAAFLVGAVADADAWQRKTTFDGPRGGGVIDASGGCADGACQSAATRTGPAGRTAARSADRSCLDGTCAASQTRTGPAGRTATRETTVTR